MASFNKVILVGNLTADPELRQTTNGVSVCSFSLAINRRTKTEGLQKADFVSVVAWRQTAEFVAKYFGKGRPLLVCGQLQTRTCTDAQGNKRYYTEVVADEVAFVESKGGDETDTGAYVPSAYTSPPSFEVVEDDDDLSF